MLNTYMKKVFQNTVMLNYLFKKYCTGKLLGHVKSTLVNNLKLPANRHKIYSQKRTKIYQNMLLEIRFF